MIVYIKNLTEKPNECRDCPCYTNFYNGKTMFILYFIIMYIGARLDAGMIYFVAASIWYLWWLFHDDD